MNTLTLTKDAKKELYKKKLQKLLEKSNSLDKRYAQLIEDDKQWKSDKLAFDKEFTEFGLQVCGKDPQKKGETFNMLECMRILND